MDTITTGPADRDEERLAALDGYRILDTGAEPAFDDVAFIASQICRTPIALVSLIERDRQWFKARIGFEPSETPIASSVCAHALGQTEILVIPDLMADPRTRTNPLVTGAEAIRFYAGAPLVAAGGVVIGTLCVIDTVPRPEGLSPDQARALAGLAAQVIGQLELRKALREIAGSAARETAALRASETRSRTAQEAGRIGTFELDLGSGRVQVSAETCRLFGLPVAPDHPAAAFEALIMPEDSGLMSSPASRMDATAATEVEYRVRRSDDGKVRWIARRAEFARDGTGQPVRMIGTVQDVTDRRRLQEHQSALLALGGTLRDMGDGAEIAATSAAVLGGTLAASSAGYGTLSPDGEVVMILRDWTNPGRPAPAARHQWRDHAGSLADLRQGRTVVVGDAEQDERTRQHAPTLRASGALAFIGCPLMRQDRCVGLVYVTDSAARSWSPQDVALARAVADLTFAAVARVEAEADQRVLNQEISHRLKNTLAMVQAIATQTLRSVPGREPVLLFEKRMLALATAHDVLLRRNWSGASFKSIVDAGLGTFGRPDLFEVAGPDVRLGPRATLSASLLLHELATNALKYGSLSVETGRVALTWRTDDAKAGPEFVMSWREFGGPPTREPNRKGFGSRLIRMGLVGTGGVELRYGSTGFEAEMRAPLAQIQLS